MVHIYLSGPMSGHPDFNRPAFHNAAYLLRAIGYAVTSPAEQEIGGASWSDYMRHDLALMMKADCVVTLEGWRQSRGASLEVYVAEQIGIPVYDLAHLLNAEGHSSSRLDSGVRQLSLNL
ncbi:DUF4406 domain-containing protein [Alicyclobacillus fastidiosus]|uniref:DUF4406 domain-containing protein n=1 Tax=Alicyclobacillus fastidiosus TaxID=392011 RepID=A0ABV5AEE5_9BACL|nr:DUF4406 domain-containing protein [Alicyclobacillus fastidiosus]WEH09865.1 DUF4406 domain-containing protein [Alicyclobacillus fastidiosus]